MNASIYPWHEQELQLIQKLITEHKLPRVILLYGAQGSGKATFAKAIAHVIGSGNLALLSDDQDDSIKVDDIRELITSNSTREFNGLSRVNIILNIKRLTESAANALLKILEDCTNSYFIFTITALNMAKPTILSRCFKLNLSLSNAAQLLKAREWLTANSGLSMEQQDTLLAITNHGPVQALQLSTEDYLGQLTSLEQVLQSLHSKNIISSSTNILKIINNPSKKDSPKAKFNSSLFINMLYYLLNTKLINKYTLKKVTAMNNLLLACKRDLDRGLSLDSENLIFRLLYRLQASHE